MNLPARHRCGKWLLLSVALLGGAGCLNSGSEEKNMDTTVTQEPIMMLYGRFHWHSDNPDDYFDASHWFESGMYKRRPSKWGPGGFSYNSMFRVSIPPIPDSDLEDWRVAITVGLSPEMERTRLDPTELPPPPEDYRKYTMDEQYDPRPGLFYIASYFPEKDKACDTYGLLVLIEGKRYYIHVERDPLTGKVLRADRSTGFALTDEEEDAYIKVIEEHQNRSKQTDAAYDIPAPMPVGATCPQEGWWSAEGGSEGPYYFKKGGVFPDFKRSPASKNWQWFSENLLK
jgi:hypothetical protein